MVVSELQIVCSLVAARYYHKQMLDFSALHQIVPTIEKFPMTKEGITQAIQKLESGNMRYRGVLIRE